MATKVKSTDTFDAPTEDEQLTVPPAAHLGITMPDVLGKTGIHELMSNESPYVSNELLGEMWRKDGHSKALIQLVLLPLRYALENGTWVGDGEKEVEFANQMLTLPKSEGGMTTPFNKLVRQMVLSLIYGFAPFEQVYQSVKKGPLKGKWTLKKLNYCEPDTVKIVVDDLGGFEGFTQRTHAHDGKLREVHVKQENAVIFTHQDEINPYYGVSMFEASYSHYEIRRKLYYIAHLAAQFAAVPGRIGTVPRHAQPREIAEFKQALSNFAFNTSMVKYDGWVIEPFSSNSGFDFLRLIDHHKSMMTKSILAGFFDSENRTVLIENATQDASADLFLLTLETLSKDIANILSDYVMPKFIDWNFGSDSYPRFEPAKLTDSNKDAVLDLFRTFAISGVLNSTPEMVREMEKRISESFNLNIDYDKIAEREKEAAEEQARQDAEMQAMQADEEELPQAEPNETDNRAQTTPTEGAPNPTPDDQGNVSMSVASDEGNVSMAQPTNPADVSLADFSMANIREMDTLVEMAQKVFVGAE